MCWLFKEKFKSPTHPPPPIGGSLDTGVGAACRVGRSEATPFLVVAGFSNNPTAAGGNPPPSVSWQLLVSRHHSGTAWRSFHQSTVPSAPERLQYHVLIPDSVVVLPPHSRARLMGGGVWGVGPTRLSCFCSWSDPSKECAEVPTPCPPPL